MAKSNDPLSDLWEELRKVPHKVLDLLAAIWAGIAAIGRVILNAFGYLYISVWLVYCKLRLRLDPKLGTFFLTAAIVDFGMLIVLHVPELDRRIHENRGKDPAWHMAWWHALGHGCMAWLSNEWGSAIFYISAFSWGKHSVHFLSIYSSDILIAISSVSLGLSVLMFVHHHQATERDESYRSLFPELIEMGGRAARIDGSDSASRRQCIEAALHKMTETGHSRPRAGAKVKIKRASTVLEGNAGADVFTLLYKWPGEAYPAAPVGNPVKATAAQKALEPPTRVAPGTPENQYEKGIVSVPWTAVRHGIRHWHDIAAGKWRVEYVRNAYSNQENCGVPKLLSLICTEIAVRDRGYVLCLDSRWPMSLRRIDFNMLSLAANIIGRLLESEVRPKSATAPAGISPSDT